MGKAKNILGYGLSRKLDDYIRLNLSELKGMEKDVFLERMNLVAEREVTWSNMEHLIEEMGVDLNFPRRSSGHVGPRRNDATSVAVRLAKVLRNIIDQINGEYPGMVVAPPDLQEIIHRHGEVPTARFTKE